MLFEVEKKIEIPSPRGPQKKYPFPEMGIGDSFSVPLNGETGVKVQSRVSNAAVSWGRRQHVKIKFTVRQLEDCVRVWRIG